MRETKKELNEKGEQGSFPDLAIWFSIWQENKHKIFFPFVMSKQLN